MCPKSASLSGVYDVRYSRNLGSNWADMLTGITVTQTTYQPDGMILFRVHTTDRVGNEGYSSIQGPYRGALHITKHYQFAGDRVAMRQCVVGDNEVVVCDAPVDGASAVSARPHSW